MNAQVQVLQDAEFLQRKTPLWYYILAEADFSRKDNALTQWAARLSLRC